MVFFMLHREYKYVLFEEDGGNVIFIWKVFSQCTVSEVNWATQEKAITAPCLNLFFSEQYTVIHCKRTGKNTQVMFLDK